jgi:hypothetical protein
MWPDGAVVLAWEVMRPDRKEIAVKVVTPRVDQPATR